MTNCKETEENLYMFGLSIYVNQFLILVAIVCLSVSSTLSLQYQ